MTPEQLARLPTTLFEIGKLVGGDLDPALLLAKISELVCRLIDAEACSVMLLDAGKQRLLPKAAYGLRAEKLSDLRFAVGEGVAGWVVAHGEAARIDDVAADPRFVRLPGTETAIASMLCVPLTARGEVVGVITATAARVAAFEAHHLELLRFVATTIALDIENVRLHKVSVTDVLTGAFNREFLAQRLPAEVESAAERGVPLALAMVDVDHFKSVNDRLGHDTGDDVLAEVARRLRASIRGGDLLVRYGGEEFLVLLPRADLARAWEVGERMRAKVGGEPIVTGLHDLRVTISVGCAQLRGGPAREAPLDLVRRADGALLAAKTRGRDRVEVAR